MIQTAIMLKMLSNFTNMRFKTKIFIKTIIFISSDLDIDIEDNGDKTFSIYYTVKDAGDYTISIKFGGELVPGGCYTFTVCFRLSIFMLVARRNFGGSHACMT